MNIEINQELLDKSVNEHITKAVDNALAGYNVREAIGQKISEAVASGAIGEAISNAVSSMDTNALTLVLAEQIQRTMTGAVCNIVEEGVCGLLLKLRGVQEYDRDRFAKEKAEIMASLRGRRE